jgi:hypothetical protein
MKNSKQPLQELDLSTYLAIGTAGKLIYGGVALVITRKVIKFFGSKIQNGKDFWSILRDPRKLFRAGVTDDEARALYANKGAALVDLGRQFSKDVYKKVKEGKITPEEAVNQLDGIIPDSDKQAWLTKFKAMSPGKTAASTIKPAVKYTKVSGSLLPMDDKFKQAVIKTFGPEANIGKLYTSYRGAFESNSLAIPFKNKSVFPSKQEWLEATGYKPKNAVISLNDKLIAQTNAYNWQKFIWTLYR